MLNVKRLSDLLAKNVDTKLYPRMFIMSPNGTLLAYSTPVDIKELRDQAALISMAWKEHETALKARGTGKGGGGSGNADGQGASSPPAQPLETLTIEFQSNNLLVRAIQPKLLLVLVGGVPPGRTRSLKMTPEAAGDERYPPDDAQGTETGSLAGDQGADQAAHVGSPQGSVAASHMSQREKDIKHGVLHIQRKKLDRLTAVIREDFNAKGFVMPDDSAFP